MSDRSSVLQCTTSGKRWTVQISRRDPISKKDGHVTLILTNDQCKTMTENSEIEDDVTKPLAERLAAGAIVARILRDSVVPGSQVNTDGTS